MVRHRVFAGVERTCWTGAAPRWLRVALLALATLLPAVDASAWWDTRWSHRRKLTFDNSGQAENLGNFPVLIVLNSSRIDYGKTRAGGIDLRFVDANDSTLLSHEIESWNPSGNSYVWVRVPQVDASSSTDFMWMYYGNPTAPNAENIPLVWSPGFVMVHHLNETVTDGTHVDSATNDGFANDASTILVQAQGTATGIIDGADSFVRPSNHRIDVPDSPALDMAAGDAFTVEAWVRTNFSASYQMAYSKESRGSPGDGEIQLWTDSGTASFWLNDGAGNTARVGSAANVADDAWHYLVGRWNESTGFAEIFVDGVNVSIGGGQTPGTLGAVGTVTPAVIGDEGDDSGGGGAGGAAWAGLLDEIRVSKVLRSDNWIKAQNKSMRDDTFVSYGAEAAHCCQLGVSETASTITIAGAGRFEATFDQLRGGGLANFYDLEEDPGRAYDLAGKPSSNFHGLFHSSITSAAILYTTGTNTNGAKLDLLEATPVRVRLRQEAFYQRVLNPAILAGAKGTGDYSVYAQSVALRWNRKTTADLPESDHPLEIGVRRENAPDPRNILNLYSQTDGVFPNPAGDDFVLAQRETPGVRTDFLAILSEDWPAADTLTASTTAAFFSWRDNVTVSPVPAGTSQSWNLLVHFKPTSFLDHLDSAVTSRSADYRGPATLTINGAKGSRWAETSENTAAAGDWFNEAEAAYVLDLDPALGLDFDISGSGPSPRYRPFFKIRQWRSFVETPLVTLEGAALVKNTGYRAAVKPVARAHFEKDLLWYSTLESAAAVTSPQAGTGGTVVGADFPATAPFRHGGAARFDTDGEYIQVPTASNFSSAEGAIEFWYLPSYDYGSGVVSDDMGLFGYEIDNDNRFNIWHEPYAGGAGSGEGLYFDIRVGGVIYSTGLGAGPSFPMRWRANDWVHLRFAWKSDPATPRLEIWVNGKFASPAPAGSYAVPLALSANVYIGDRQTNGFTNNAMGRIDEFRIYDTADAPTELAHGGLLADSREQLANPALDYTFTFAQEDANHRGEYLYLGADSKFRGLNVSLATPGIGAGLDLEWQYWDGTTWQDLEATPGFTDQTNHLTAPAGTIFWASDPTGWDLYSLRGGPDLYYVRARLKSGSYGGQFPREHVIKTDILLFQYCHDVVAAAQTFIFAVPPTTEVELSSFTASPGDGSVLLEWRTESELDNLGFHLYRALSDAGPWTRLTSSLIPGLGSSAVGQAYSYRDTGLSNGTRYFYRLEDVDASSKVTSHGPVSAVPQAGAAGEDGTQGDPKQGEDKKSAVPSSCPAWVLSAYESAAGADAVPPSLRCTRHGDPEATSFSVLCRDARQATLELRTGGFYALHESPGSVRVFVPGFGFPQDETAAALPIRRGLVEAVVGRRVQLGGVRALELRGFRGLVPSALGVAEMHVGRDGTVRATRRGVRPAEAARRVGSRTRVAGSRGGAQTRFPHPDWVTLLPSQFQGETKSAVVEIAPLRFDAQRRQLVLAKRVRIKLLFTGREAGESGRGSVGRAPGSRKTAPSGEVLARLFTTSVGLHAVPFEELFPGHRRGVQASELRLERQDEAVAFHVEPATSTLGPGSRLFFHANAVAASTDYAGEVAYELVSSREGLRMPTVSAAPGSGAIASDSVVTRAFEAERFYQPGLLEATDPWLWEAVSSGATRVVSFTLAGVSATGIAGLEVELQGASESGQPVDHHPSVSVNGTLVGEAQFAGKQPYRMSLSLPVSLLRVGTNELRLTNVADTGVTSFVFLDRFTVAHPQAATQTSGVFEGTWGESGTATVSGVAGAAALVELTARGGVSARWLSGYAASGGAVSFHAEAGRTYLVVSQPLGPRVSRPEPTTLRATTNQADYLLITPKAFLAAAEPLVARRQDQGLTARAVSFEEIAAAFGHGRPSAEAIRSFLAYAFHSWQRPSPRYVLLLGDASYDPRNFSGVSQPSPLPVLWTKTSYLWTASDPLLAAVNGEDGLPDLAIGRLPATTLEQVDTLVAKLLAWEDSGQGLAGAAALVADNPDVAGDFEQDVRDIAQSYLADRGPELLFLSEHGSGLRPRIQEALDRGLSFLSYVGHGGAAVWASENVWNSWDAPSLQAQSQQPLLVTMNCLNGYFVAPSFDSLSESLLKADGRGAIASFSPSGLSLDGPAHQYHRALMAALTSGRHERLGDAILAAQKTYADSGLMPELIGVYHLLGDPATRIR